jgi:hypothetical protein
MSKEQRVIDDAVCMVEDFMTEQFEGDTPDYVRYQIANYIAPELLAALELINIDKAGDGFICKEAMVQVQAAISKAKGE